MRTYDLKRGTFSNYVWINSGAMFINPSLLNVEMVTAGAYGIEVCRADGTVVATARRPNEHGGWASFYFREGGEFGPEVRNGAFKIKLVNRSSGTRQLRGGDLEYEV